MGRLEDTSILKRVHASNGSTKRGVALQAGWMTAVFGPTDDTYDASALRRA